MAGCRNQLNAVGGWLHLFVCLSAGSDKIQRSHGPDSGGMAKSECLRLAQGPKVSPSGRKLPAGGYSENLETRQPADISLRPAVCPSYASPTTIAINAEGRGRAGADGELL
jgi:hypothetical protein